MFKVACNVLFVLGLVSAAACAVDAEQVEETTTAAAATVPELDLRPLVTVPDIPWWQSNQNFCAALNGLSFAISVEGCTTTRTLSNCTPGAQRGTCRCDVTTERSGSC